MACARAKRPAERPTAAQSGALRRSSWYNMPLKSNSSTRGPRRHTTAKKSNPDPNQWVGWGDRTVDEMAHAWINIVYMKDEDFKVEQEKRRAATTNTTAGVQQ